MSLNIAEKWKRNSIANLLSSLRADFWTLNLDLRLLHHSVLVTEDALSHLNHATGITFKSRSRPCKDNTGVRPRPDQDLMDQRKTTSQFEWGSSSFCCLATIWNHPADVVMTRRPAAQPVSSAAHRMCVCSHPVTSDLPPSDQRKFLSAKINASLPSPLAFCSSSSLLLLPPLPSSVLSLFPLSHVLPS